MRFTNSVKMIFFISVMLLFLGIGFNVQAEESDDANPADLVTIDTSSSSSGIVKVKFTGNNKTILKVFVSKESQKYTYDLNANGNFESYSLQMGNGSYVVTVLENIADTRYRALKTQTFDVQLENEDIVFLESVQNVKWDSSSKAVKKDIELIGNEKTVEKKLDIVYNFLVKGFTYDFNKVKTVKAGYVPDVEVIVDIKKGICYDYSAVFAVMKRSEGFPTKLVKGYTKNVSGYHAWNEIKINGKWLIIDSTYDSAVWKKRIKYEMVKKPQDYKKVYEY